MVSSKDFLFGGAEPRKDSAALSLHFPLPPTLPIVPQVWPSRPLTIQMFGEKSLFLRIPLFRFLLLLPLEKAFGILTGLHLDRNKSK